jgi:hypothetical protein
MVGSETSGATKALRWAGIASLVTVAVIDAIAPSITKWRRAAATKAINVADGLAPTENFLLDVALGLLAASDRKRS